MTKRILCYGDSNTWGFSPVDGHRMAGRWTRSLDLPDFYEAEIIEEGLNGRNAFSKDEFAPEKCGIHMFKTMLSSHKPLDLVVLMLGTNDLKSPYHNSARNIALGLREYVRQWTNPSLYEDSPMPALLIVSPIHLGDHLPELAGEGGSFNEYSLKQSHLLAGEIEKAIEPYRKDFPVHFLDASQFAGPSQEDGLHMLEEEHRKLADAISRKIRDILGE